MVHDSNISGAAATEECDYIAIGIFKMRRAYLPRAAAPVDW